MLSRRIKSWRTAELNSAAEVHELSNLLTVLIKKVFSRESHFSEKKA